MARDDQAHLTQVAGALQQASRPGAEIMVTRNAVGIDPVAKIVELDGGEPAPSSWPPA